VLYPTYHKVVQPCDIFILQKFLFDLFLYHCCSIHQAVLELFLILADRKGNFALGCDPLLFLPCPHSFDSSLEFFRWKKTGRPNENHSS
jgi:hypothetical protein